MPTPATYARYVKLNEVHAFKELISVQAALYERVYVVRGNECVFLFHADGQQAGQRRNTPSTPNGVLNLSGGPFHPL